MKCHGAISRIIRLGHIMRSLMRGFELAREARAAMDCAVTRIALTGYGQEEDRRAALAAGFDRHLTKPLSFDELKKTLAA